MRKRLARTIIISGMLLGLAAVGLELILRVFPDLRPSDAQLRIDEVYHGDANRPGWSVPDDELGFLGRPRRRDFIEAIDFSFTFVSDRYGFANAEPWPERADVVFLGDSLLTGAGVGLDGQFTSLVAKGLPGLSVINLALPGGSPEHHLRIFRRFGAKFQPQLVVVCLYVASDVDNAKHFDAWQKEGRQWSYNEFRMSHYRDALARIVAEANPDPDNVADTGAGPVEPGWRLALRTAVNAMAIGTELVYLLDPWRKGILHDVAWPDGSRVFLYRRFQTRLERGIGDEYPSIPAVFFDPLVELRQEVESTGSTFLIVLIPSKEEIFRVPGRDGALRLVAEVRRTLDDLDMAVLDSYPAIAEVARTTAPFYAHDIHLSPAGNDAIANAVIDWIDQHRAGK